MVDSALSLKDNVIVKKSNALARARNVRNNSIQPTIWEGRVVAVVAAQVKEDDAIFKEYNIPVSLLFKNINKRASGYLYSDLVDICRVLKQRNVEIESEKKWVSYSLFSKCQYVKGDKFITVRFDPDLKEHFLGLKSYFTAYALHEYMSLPSVYSQNLYEFLRSWDDRDTIEFELEVLHDKLDVSNTMRKNFGEFRRNALEKAEKDINSLTTLKYKWKPIREGRKVVNVQFTFLKKKKVPPKPMDESVISEEVLDIIPANQHLSCTGGLKTILKEKGPEQVLFYVEYTLAQHNKKAIKNWGAYINKLYKQDLYTAEFKKFQAEDEDKKAAAEARAKAEGEARKEKARIEAEKEESLRINKYLKEIPARELEELDEYILSKMTEKQQREYKHKLESKPIDGNFTMERRLALKRFLNR